MKKEETGAQQPSKVKTVLSPEAKEFIRALSEKSKKKFDEIIKKTEAGFSGAWFKKLTGTDGLYEFSFDTDNHFYRVFAFWDKRNNQNTLIVCTHGIAKKTNKTPDAAIQKAERMKKDWFASQA